MVVTLLASCVLLGFIAADSILNWRHLYCLIRGVSAEDLPVPLSWKIMLPFYAVATVLCLVGLR